MKLDNSKESLKPAALAGADSAVLTIKEVSKQDSRSGGMKLVITPAEHPDAWLWVNKTGERELIRRYGNETTAWVGRKFAVVAETVEMSGENYHKLNIAIGAVWDTVFKAFKVEDTKAPRSK